ncbi:MAG: MFS transporter [Thermomicrobiales bacterium]
MRWKPTGVWLNSSYRMLWRAATVSAFGSQITGLAIPLLAATTLHASALEFGVLAAAQNLAIPIFGLFAGVIADHRARRPLLIFSDLARALVLLTIPIAWWTDRLSIPLLIVVSFLSGAFGMLFDVTRQSIVPNLVSREQLVAGNGKLYTSEAAADLTGPGLAGVLVQLIGAPASVLLDCVSYFASAIFLIKMRLVETVDRSPLGIRRVFTQLGEGFDVFRSIPLLRSMGIATASGNLFESARTAILVLFMTRELHLSAAYVGAVYACGGLGFFVGSLLPEWFSNRFGLGKAIVIGLLIFMAGDLLYPFAGGPKLVAAGILATAMFIGGVGGGVFDINQFSLRQAMTPDSVRGRVNAVLRVMIRGIAPVGALIGGLIAELIGLRAALVFAALSSPVSLLVIYRAKIHQLRTIPESEPSPVMV